jgi:morphogenetic protein associated with SpoVID
MDLCHRREIRVKIHIVQKGDTLWKIAKKYGVNFEELKKMNSQLSNPDMIMPGMKVKVPTTGGMIKKEAPMGTKPGTTVNLGVKKEMPIVEHPFAKEKPMPVPMPVVEAPKKEVPIIKEAPKVPYTPKMPLQVVPEIDINNYYTMNMQNMTVQQPQLPPKPANILPEIKEVPKKEMPVVVPPPMVKQPVMEQPVMKQPVMEQPVSQDYCVPVTPVMPGPGFCPPFEPFMPFAGVQGAAYPCGPSYMPMPTAPANMPIMPANMPIMPANMPTMPANMPTAPAYMPTEPSYMPGPHGFVPGGSGVTPMVAGASYMPQHFADESSSFMPQMPSMNPGYNPDAVMGVQNPAYGQTPYMNPSSPYPMAGYEHVPAGYPGAGPAGYPGAGPAGYPGAGPAGYPGAGPTGYPGVEPTGYSGAGPTGYSGAELTGYPETGPAGYPRVGPTGYPAGYPANYPAGYPAMGPQQGMGAPYSGQIPYGYPQMGEPGPQGMGQPSFESPEMGPYHTQGFPVGTGALGDCGCGPAVMPMAEPMPKAMPNAIPNAMPNVVPNEAPPNLVPPTPPIYSAPYIGPVNSAQPPFMNPYGMGAAGAYGMPRYVDESND